ncbi:MAG: LON peptidase substrate-binding domain-containing protein [Burkholderiaceae bacterium]|nr:LON peptidase substrate-binding domain-containing protein [Burkholderiaceae bacterium]
MERPLPDPLPLFPLQTVLFPGGLLRLRVFEARYLDLVGHCLRSGEPFGVVAIRDGHEVRRAGEPLLIERVGVLAWVDEVDADQPGLLQLRCHGSGRITLGAASQRADGLWLAPATPRADDVPTPVPATLQPCADALGRAIAALASQDQQPFLAPHALHDAGWVANRWCELLPLPQAARQRLMELDDPLARLQQVDDFLRREQVIGD